MSLIKVFDRIVEIMHHDYSGFEDKRGWDQHEYFRDQLVGLEEKGELTRAALEDIVNDYLYDFRDEHNGIRSIHKDAPPQTVGFEVRHYKDKLYITQIGLEDRLTKGQVIIKLDGVPVAEVAKISKRSLKFDTPDRENWEAVLLNATELTLENNESLELRHFDFVREPASYTCVWLDGIPVLNFNDFTSHDQMKQLMAAHGDALKTAEKWIVDVRGCRGGSDSVYFPIFKFLFPPNFEPSNIGVQHLVTETNYQNRMRSFGKIGKPGEDPFLEAFINQMEKNRGKGFVRFDFSEFKDSVQGTELPKSIVVLIDKFCGSSGEQFVTDARLSPKVTTMGRPTRGVLDYSNQAFEEFKEEGFEFFYATSRSDRVDLGEGIDFRGFKPDILISWTPEHLERDVDIEKAIQYLKEQATIK
jgi:hypothetical protein